MVTDADEVRLVVPARPEFLRLARVTAAGLAGRLGFGYDEVEDLRLAVDELCFALAGPQGREGSVELLYLLAPDRLTIEVRGRFPDGAPASGFSNLSEVILGALVDEHGMSSSPSGPGLHLTKRRRRTGGDGDG